MLCLISRAWAHIGPDSIIIGAIIKTRKVNNVILNVVLLLFGIASFIYGIKNKLKFWMVVGVILLFLGLISAGIDYKMAGAENSTNDINYRLPFLIN